MAPLLLSSEPYYAYDQYGSANNFKADSSDDENHHARGRPHRSRKQRQPPLTPPPRRRFPSRSTSGSPRGRRRRLNLKSVDGKRNLTCELNLGSKSASIDKLRWKPRTNTWPNLSPKTSSRALERINILASTTYSDQDGEATVEIQSDLDSGSSDAHFIHWLHVERDNMDLDEFESLALQSPRISDEMALVVGHLMTKVRKELEKPFVHGRYMLPDVLRCDGLDTGNSEKEDIYAIWVSIPYFSMESPNSSGSKTSPSTSHPLRTLLQSCYDFESTDDREFNHQRHKFAESELRDKVVSLPQVWCLILGTDTIITSAQKDLDTLSKPAISRTVFTGESDKASLVKIIDPYKRQFFLPIKNCRTFYELKELVVEQCLNDISLSMEDYDLVHNNLILASHNWKDTVRSTSSLIIVVSFVETKKEGRSDPSTALAERHVPGSSRDPGDKRASVETDNSSESSSDEDIEIAQAQANAKQAEAKVFHPPVRNELIIINQHRPFATHSPSRIRSKERRRNFEKVQELTRTGLIVNEPDSVPPKKTVKMYSMKPETKPAVQQHAQSSPNAGPSRFPGQVTQQKSATEQKGKGLPGQAEPSVNGSTTNQQPESATKTPKLALRIPPFFAWSLEGSAEKSGKSNTAGDLSKSRGLQHILSRVESKILQRDFELAKTYETFLEVRPAVDRRTIYRDTPTTELEDLERLKRPLGGNLQQLRQRLALLNSKLQTNVGSSTSSKGAFVLNPHFEEDDPFVINEKITLHIQLLSLLDLAEEMVACFVPRSYDHSLLKKIWGALGTLITIVSEESSEEKASEFATQPKPTPSSSRQGGKDTWTVRWFDEEDEFAAVSRNGRKLLPSVLSANCHDCDNTMAPTLYSSRADALKHLVTEHYRPHKLTITEQETISILVRNSDQQKVDRFRKDLFTIVQTFVLHLQSITASTKEMLEAVAEASEENTEFDYHLPRTLVRSFQNDVILITTAGQAVRQLQNRPRSRNSTDEEGASPNFNSLLSFLGIRAEISMTTAMKDLILMVRTGETSESVNYAAIGPRYIAIVLYKHLLTRKLMNDTSLVDFYKKRTLKLQYDVYHKPARRRILGDIQLLHEEISAALSTRSVQANAVCHFGWIGDARSYRVSNQSRNQQYDLEGDVGQACIDQIYSDKDDLTLLLQRLTTLEQKVRYRVEVLEEDNSKAIFIFTVVAAVFLPLSFVTSYLGMNTADIRDMERSQSLFWMVAVPTTFGVVTLAIFAAFRDAVKEWLRTKRRSLNRPDKSSGRPHKRVDGNRLEFDNAMEKRPKIFRSQEDLV